MWPVPPEWHAGCLVKSIPNTVGLNCVVVIKGILETFALELDAEQKQFKM